MSPIDLDLHAALKKYWGYDTFRPQQEAIVRSLLAGHDVVAIMPTGGGKSLCYQLPPVLAGKTAVVISPLIALMQDQVEQLTQMGVPAALLNSTLDFREQNKVISRATAGELRLLYISPERLAREDTLAWLKKVPAAWFAIDEAHCISEWGHEFRPEYRQMSVLREQFPEASIAAFTASATRQVRHDIVQQLRLRNPDKYIRSFRRPNLRYLVYKVDAATQRRRLLQILRHYQGRNVIVYSPTIKRVAETVEFLRINGISAVPYHGQMQASDRQASQEAWMNEEVPVLVGTIAFGLGINKPSVRAVIHLSLPKSIEQFYQEAGRAGRDGEPADCVMMWLPQDIPLLIHFIKELTDKGEIDRSWRRFKTIRSFVESSACRQRAICEHFGERPKWEACGNCDVCGSEPAWFKPAAAVPIPIPPPVTITVEPPSELVASLKQWRRDKAKARAVAAFVIMSDATLLDLCRKMPLDRSQLLAVAGMGERKAELYGEVLLRIIGEAR